MNKINFTDTHITLDFSGDDRLGYLVRDLIFKLTQEERILPQPEKKDLEDKLDAVYDSIYFNLNHKSLAEAARKDYEELGDDRD